MGFETISNNVYLITHTWRGISLPQDDSSIPSEYQGKEICVKYGSVESANKLVAVVECEGLNPLVFEQGKIPKNLNRFLETIVKICPPRPL